jgi:hypothetical protein
MNVRSTDCISKEIDPLTDARWDRLVGSHASGAVFHTTGWLQALKRSYGYEPVVLTASPDDSELSSGLLYCRVSSWVTGRRLISLPFSDHCEPLISAGSDLDSLLSGLVTALSKNPARYAEIRSFNPAIALTAGFFRAQEYCFHKIDLQPSVEEVFGNFHHDCIQRKIRRSEREHLSFEEGRSEAILQKFYALMLMTRRRHGLPPAPRKWFVNLINCLGEQVTIRVALKDETPIAAILTLRFKDVLVYKYGCSDSRFHAFGGIPGLIWRAIQDAKAKGVRSLDLGRTDKDNEGLVTFKDRLGATRSEIAYFRLEKSSSHVPRLSWSTRTAKRIFAHLPDGVRSTAGSLLYKHIG